MDEDLPEADAFPDTARAHISIPNSFRFDASIAALADGLALTPVEPDGLEGIRVVAANEEPVQHAVFVFPDGDTSQVLAAYADHVLASLDDEALKTGPAVTAVGQVHMAKETVTAGHKHFPGSVSHYWSEYRATLTRKSSPPTTLIDCLRKARSMVISGLPISEAVDVVATGFIYFINRAGGPPTVRLGSRPHRSLERLLSTHLDARPAYRTTLARFVLGDDVLSEDAWKALRPGLALLAVAVTGRASTTEMWAFAEWRESDVGQTEPAVRQSPINVFRHKTGNRTVDIQLSSIHAVKGQTHLATLVLETYHYQHVLGALMPWLNGQQSGASRRTSERDKKRLRLAYVALTRPSHVLCLAVPESLLGGDAGRAALSSHGWTVVDVGGTTAGLMEAR